MAAAHGLAPFPKLVLLTLRLGEAGWKVANYTESDPPRR